VDRRTTVGAGLTKGKKAEERNFNWCLQSQLKEALLHLNIRHFLKGCAATAYRQFSNRLWKFEQKKVVEVEVQTFKIGLQHFRHFKLEPVPLGFEINCLKGAGSELKTISEANPFFNIWDVKLIRKMQEVIFFRG
jgi:hypothetical protein